MGCEEYHWIPPPLRIAELLVKLHEIRFKVFGVRVEVEVEEWKIAPPSPKILIAWFDINEEFRIFIELSSENIAPPEEPRQDWNIVEFISTSSDK